jgi:soluble calcium-activated nucleotidase 1
MHTDGPVHAYRIALVQASNYCRGLAIQGPGQVRCGHLEEVSHAWLMTATQGTSLQRVYRSSSAGSLNAAAASLGRNGARPNGRRTSSRFRWFDMVGDARDRHMDGHAGSTNSLSSVASRQNSFDLESGRSDAGTGDQNDKGRRSSWYLGFGFSSGSTPPPPSGSLLSTTTGGAPLLPSNRLSWLRRRPLRNLLWWLLLLSVLGLFFDFFQDHLIQRNSSVASRSHDYRDRNLFRSDRAWGPHIFGVITDMDRLSAVRHGAKQSAAEWIAYFRRGEVEYRVHADSANDSSKGSWNIRWLDPAPGVRLSTQLGESGRGMELSELVHWRGHLLAPCDRTGIVYEIRDPQSAKPYAASRYVLATGDGEHVKGFKAEWMTVQHNALMVGGHGRETTDAHNGTRVLNQDALWVKRIASDADELVQHLNWTDRYERLRRAAGTQFPGYLEHEAVAWSERRSQWLFLPRRFSREPYDERKNEYRGWNGYLLADEKIRRIQMKYLDLPVDGERGFSSIKFLPYTGDRMAIALRTIEHEDEGIYRTSIILFRVDDGHVLLEDFPVGDGKYEGVEFL